MMIDKLDIPTIKKVEAIIDVYVEHMIANSRFHRILHSEVISDKHSESLEYAFSVIKKNHAVFKPDYRKGKKKQRIQGYRFRLFMTSITGTIMQLIKSETIAICWMRLRLKITQFR